MGEGGGVVGWLGGWVVVCVGGGEGRERGEEWGREGRGGRGAERTMNNVVQVGVGWCGVVWCGVVGVCMFLTLLKRLAVLRPILHSSVEWKRRRKKRRT